MMVKPIVVSANLKFHMQVDVPVDLREVLLNKESIERWIWQIAYRDRSVYLGERMAWPCALATVRDGKDGTTFSLFLPARTDTIRPVVEVSWDDHPLWHERLHPSPAVLRISACHSDGLTEVMFGPDTVVDMSVSTREVNTAGFIVSAWKRSDGGISLEWRWGTRKRLFKSENELPDMEVAILSDNEPLARVAQIHDMKSSLLVATAQDGEERILVLYYATGLWLQQLIEHIPVG